VTEKAPGPRLLEAMPRPLLLLFLAAAAGAIGIVVLLLIRPPSFDAISLEQRRPPPAGTFSHDVGEVFALPLPEPLPAYDPPCAAVAEARPLGGPAAVDRITRALAQACTLRGAGVDPILNEAVAGLSGAGIGFADFARSGGESTVDLSEQRIWLNLKLAAIGRPVRELVPVLLHEAYHLGRPDEPITAAREFDARRVEHEACRQLISRDEWPRWCEDAEAIVGLGRGRAVQLLARAGYASGSDSAQS